MIGEAAEEYYSKIGFPENEASMVRRWLHDLEPVKYLENLGHIDHCACFLTNSREGETRECYGLEREKSAGTNERQKK